MKLCPECGSETRTGWWLLWCENTKRCKWSRLMSKDERQTSREEMFV